MMNNNPLKVEIPLGGFVFKGSKLYLCHKILNLAL